MNHRGRASPAADDWRPTVYLNGDDAHGGMEENHLNLEGDAVPREDDVGDNEPGVRDPEQGLDNHSFPPVFDELRRVFLRNQLGHRLPPPIRACGVYLALIPCWTGAKPHLPAGEPSLRTPWS